MIIEAPNHSPSPKLIQAARIAPVLIGLLPIQNQFDLRNEKIEVLKARARKIDETNHQKAKKIMGTALEKEAELKLDERIHENGIFLANYYPVDVKKAEEKKEPEPSPPKLVVLSEKDRVNYQRQLRIAEELGHKDEAIAIEKILGISEEKTENKKQDTLSDEFNADVATLQTTCLKCFESYKDDIVVFDAPIYKTALPVPSQPDKIIGKKEFQVLRLQINGSEDEDRFVQLIKHPDGTVDMMLMRNLIGKFSPTAHNTIPIFFLNEEDNNHYNVMVNDSVNIGNNGCATVTTSSTHRENKKNSNELEKKSLRSLNSIEAKAISDALIAAKVFNLKELH